MQLTEAGSAPPAPTSAATRSSAAARSCGRRRLAGRRRPHRLHGQGADSGPKSRRLGRPARHLPALLRSRDLQPGSAGNDADGLQLQEQRTRGARIPRPAGALHHRKGVKVEWPTYKVGDERIKYFVAGKPKQDLELPFYTIWKTTAVPAAKIACTLTTSAGEGDRPAPRAPEEELAADRRRSRRTEAEEARRSRRRRGRRRRGLRVSGRRGDQQLRPFPHPFADLVQLRVGRGAVHPLGVERPAHRHRVLDAEVGAEPGRLGLGAGQDRRHPVVDRRDHLVRRRGDDRAAVEQPSSSPVPWSSHSLRVQSPAKAKGSPPSTVKARVARLLGVLALIHS